MEAVSREMKIADIVLAHSECAVVLRRHRIDFRLRGALRLDEACLRRGVDSSLVLRELNRAIAERSAPREVGADTPTDALLQHLVDNHHRYLRDVLPMLVSLAKTVARLDRAEHVRLTNVRDLVQEFSDTLLLHLDREESEVFRAASEDASAPALLLLPAMEDDHVEVQDLLEEIRQATDEVAEPPLPSLGFRVLMRELAYLEANTRQHLHLENGILLPRLASKAPARAVGR